MSDGSFVRRHRAFVPSKKQKNKRPVPPYEPPLAGWLRVLDIHLTLLPTCLFWADAPRHTEDPLVVLNIAAAVVGPRVG